MKLTILHVLLLFALSSSGQESSTKEKRKKNVIGTYVGLIELNLYYERNIIQRPKSHTNFRIGFGYLTDLQVEGMPINATLVQMFGKKKSFLELNLGVKYILVKTSWEEDFVLPEVYLGYRYEKPEGKFMFRSGLSYPSLLNIGFGIKL